MKINFKISIGLPKCAEDIRNIVFIKEQGFIVDLDDLDKTCMHIVMYYNDIPVGTARILKESDTVYHIGRFAILKEYRNKGLGSRLLHECENFVKTNNIKIIRLDAQYDKRKFYLTNGYKILDKNLFLDENYPHIKLIKNL